MTGLEFNGTRQPLPRISSRDWVAGRVRLLIIAAAAMLPLSLAAQLSAQQRGPASVADIAEPLKSAVVNIATTQKLKENQEVPLPDVPKGSPFEEFFEDFFERGDRGSGQRANSLGSGFVIDPNGLVVTNNHVIEGADEITVIFTDGAKYKVTKVLGRDPKTDLALLQVSPKEQLPYVKFGNSDAMRVGDWVMAIGNPFGLGGSVTVGVISATRRDIQSGQYDEFLQTDAAINRGNSGGPLFNMAGEVIGVNTAIISPTGGSIGIGFAVPANTARNVLDQLQQHGETRRGWLGVRIQTVTDEMAESVGLTTAGGAMVAYVIEGGPAAAAGIQVGDIIVSFDGQEINAMRQFPKLVAQTPIDKEVDATVFRKGEAKKLRIKVGRLDEGASAAKSEKPEEAPPAVQEKPRKKSSLGLNFAGMNDELRSRYKIDRAVSGVVITEVDPEGPAADKELKEGDVVVEVTHEKVASVDELNARFEELRKLNRKNALLTLADAQGQLSFVAIALGDE
jgi:serine protease Do